MLKLSALLFASLTFLLPISQANARGFCGQVDFERVQNEELENIVYWQSFARGNAKPIQCGLRGESLSICTACSNEIPEAMMQVLRPVLGQEAHLDWHARWHKIRTNSNDIDEDGFRKIRDAGLVPATATRDEFFARYAAGGSLAGENFFYMHRTMIKMVQFELAMNGLSCIDPWRDLPVSVLDPSWPVPRKFGSSSQRGREQNRLNQLRSQLADLYKPAFLKRVSLNELGLLLEPGLHQVLHSFYRSDPPNSPEALAQNYQDDLLPVKSSPLNKHFWKIHGLVDEVMGAWLEANGYETIAVSCGGKPRCYQWEGTWLGKGPR